MAVCTGHRTVAHTDSTNELEKLQEAFTLSEDELHRIYTDSVEMSFASPAEKEHLLDLW